MVEYRKIYQVETGRTIPDVWDIHHIDENRNNNNIKNLVALPKIIHTEVHEALRGMMFKNIQAIDIMSGLGSVEFILKDELVNKKIAELRHFFDTMELLNYYILVREYLTGDKSVAIGPVREAVCGYLDKTEII